MTKPNRISVEELRKLTDDSPVLKEWSGKSVYVFDEDKRMYYAHGAVGYRQSVDAAGTFVFEEARRITVGALTAMELVEAKALYCLGFLFRRDGTEVALIRKNRPKWQEGKLNGIGGKLLPGELPEVAMVREFGEETGWTGALAWRQFAAINLCYGRIFCFTCLEGDGVHLQSVTDETVQWRHALSQTAQNSLRNLAWLVPMALDKDRIRAEVWDVESQQQ